MLFDVLADFKRRFVFFVYWLLKQYGFLIIVVIEVREESIGTVGFIDMCNEHVLHEACV